MGQLHYLGRSYPPKVRGYPLLNLPSTDFYWNVTGFGPDENFATNPPPLWFVTDPTMPDVVEGGVTKAVVQNLGNGRTERSSGGCSLLQRVFRLGFGSVWAFARWARQTTNKFRFQTCCSHDEGCPGS